MNSSLLKKSTPFLFFLLALFSPTENFAQRPDLGTVADFALFTPVGAVGSTGISTVTGKVGNNIGALTGFDPLLNELHNADAVSAQCSADVLIAYNELNGRVPTIFPIPVLGNGQVLYPGVYFIPQAATLNGSLTFDAQGNSNAIFIIQVQGAFSTTASSVVHLINGASANNIFWKVEGAVAMATYSIMKGTFIANNGAFSMAAGCELEGRGLSTTGAVAINGAKVTVPVSVAPPAPPCAIVTGSFDGLGNGTTMNNSPTGWYLDTAQVAGASNFSVKANRFLAEELGGVGIWVSRVFSVAGNSDFRVGVKIKTQGNLNSSEYVRLYYKIDGGAEILFGSRTGDFGSMDFVSPKLTGNNVQMIVKIYNYDNGGPKSKHYIDDYRVFKEMGPCVVSFPITIDAENGGVLTNINPLSTLSAITTASGTTTYSWTGPEGFVAGGSRTASQDLDASVEGVYNLYATNSYGSGSTCYTVTSNTTPPNLTATGGALTCASSIIIHASSTTAGVTYSWTGPNGFTSTLQNPTVTAVGNYTVTARNPANGATTSKTVTVTGPVPATFWIENFSFANGTKSDAGTTPWTSATGGTGTYSVQNNEFKTSFCAMAEGIWTSGVVNIAGKSNVVISVALRSETAAGSNYFETDDYIRVYYKLNGGAQILAYQDLAGVGNSTSGTASFNLSSVTLNGSTLQVIIKTKNSDLTERYYFDNVKLTSTVTSAPVTIVTSVTGVATCTATAQVFATATPAATGYSWTGPNGFTSTLQNPVVTAGGQYIVTATTGTGCTAIGTVTVTQNKTPPDITATGGILGCLLTTSVNANSSVVGATYLWSGPNGFTSTAKNPSVSAIGTYTVTVKNPANGCTASAPAQVTSGASAFWLENFSWPNFTTSDAGATSWAIQSMVSSSRFYVYNNEFKVSSVGTATGSENVWASGIINISGKSNISVSAMVHSVVTGSGVMSSSGVNMDYIRFYYKLNGGAEVMFGERISAINNHSSTLTTVSAGSLSGSSLQIIVRGRATGSDEYYYFDNVQVNGTGNVIATASANGKLTCTNSVVTISGNSSITGATYSWSGPGGFSSGAQNPSVNAGGIYTLTATDPSTGCSGTDTANVVQESVSPGAMASAMNQLSCSVTQAVLSGSSSAPGASYSWTGPNGFTSTLQNPVVTDVGVYTLTVITGGCSSSDTALVVQDNTGPDAVPTITSTNTELNCVSNTVRLEGNSSVPGVSYKWTLPNGSILNFQSIDVYDPGVYTLTVSDSATGCSSSAVITVNQNIAAPVNLVVDSIPLLSCINPSVVINASSSTPNISYNWSGPDGFVDSSSSITTNIPGEYIVTVTDPVNGCTNSAITMVNKNPPVIINATPASGQITCVQNSVALDGSTSPGALLFAWTGPNDYSSSDANITVTMPGDYTLVTTDANGCPDSSIFLVTENKFAPVGVGAGNSGQINCYISSVFVMGTSTTPEATFNWTGPDGFTSSEANAETEFAGTYTLLVTNPLNGCTATAVAIVEAHTNAPEGLTAINSGPLNCLNPTVTLTGTSTSTGVDYTWQAPDQHLIAGAIVDVSTAGTYNLIVTDMDNGCVSFMPTTILQNSTGCSRMIAQDTTQAAPVQKPVTGQDTVSTVTGFEYRTYPNPFSEIAFIEFRSPAPSRVTVELYNNNGVVEKVLFNSAVVPNQLYKLVLKAGSLHAGVYYCVIRSNGQVYSSKLLYMY